MSKKSFRQALNEGMRQEMERDPTVIVMGEDIAGGMGSKGEQDAWGDVLVPVRVCSEIWTRPCVRHTDQ